MVAKYTNVESTEVITPAVRRLFIFLYALSQLIFCYILLLISL